MDAVNPYYFQAFADVQAFGALSFNVLVNTTHDLKYVPELATEVPLLSNGLVTVEGDRMDVNWKLKPGMKWSDGEPITCADLEATWKWNVRSRQHRPRRRHDGLGGHRVGRGTLRHRLRDPLQPALRGLPRAVQRGPARSTTSRRVPVADAVTRSSTRWVTSPRASTAGPTSRSRSSADAQITFAPNPNWETISGHAPYLDQVIFKYYGDAAAMIAGYRAGETDFAMELNNTDLPSLSDLPQDEVVIHDALTYELFAFNNKRFREQFGDDT